MPDHYVSRFNRDTPLVSTDDSFTTSVQKRAVGERKLLLIMSNVLKLGKKVFTTGVVFSTMLWSVGVGALVPVAAQAEACPTFHSGDLVKVVGHPAIYSIDSNGKVLYFPSGDEFKSWNVDSKYGGYTSISQACYDTMPVPSVSPYGVNFRPGSYVVKRASSDQLYVVEPGNMLAKITAGATSALYGAGYKVMTVADVFWPNYVGRGADVTEAKAQPGMLVSNGGKTWYVDASSKLWEVTTAGMAANRFKAAFVRPVADSVIAGLLSSGAALDSTNAIVADRTQTGGGSTTLPGTTPATGGALTVSLSASNPAGNNLASNTAFNPVLKLNLTAGSNDVSVNSLTLTKSGFAANTAVSGIDVIDAAGLRHGTVVASIGTDNTATLLFTANPIVVKAGTTQEITVRVNLSSTATSGTVVFGVTGAASVGSNASGVSGSFPVAGNSFTLQNGTNSVAGITLDVSPVNASGGTFNIDPANEQDITKFSFQETTSKEDVVLKSLSIYNLGTSADSDLQDVQLVALDGSVLATAQQVNKNVVFNLSATPYPIGKGLTKYLTVRAKFINGTNRYVQFVVYNNYDAALTGVTTGANLLPAVGSTDTTFPIGDATNYNKATINTGTVTFNKDATSPSGSVVPGASNIVLAKFFAKPNGEDMELRKVGFGVVTGTASVFTGSLTIRVNGAAVYTATPADIANTSTEASLTSVTLSSYPILTNGQNNTITVEGNISTSATNGATSTIALDLTQVRRAVTNDTLDPSVSVSNGNQMTVQAAALKTTNLSTPVAQSLVPGTSAATLATIELNAGSVSSGEDVKVSKVIISDVISGGSLANISNLALFDQNNNQLPTSASTATNAASNTFTFINPIVVPKTGAVILTLKGDVIAGSSGTHTYGITSAGSGTTAADVTAVGKDTGNSPTFTAGSGAGQAMTVTGSGTLTLSLVSGANGAPSVSQNKVVGETNVPVFAFKMTALNEPLKLKSLTLTASGTLNTPNDLGNIKLYMNNGTSPFASAAQMSATADTGSTTFTWSATDNLLPSAVQPGSPVTIYVKADIGLANQARLGDFFAFKINQTGDITVKGASSGATLAASSITGAPVKSNAGIYTYITPFGVIATSDSPTANSSQTLAVGVGTTLGRIKLTNNGSAKITVTGIKFTDSGTHTVTASAPSYILYYSDEGTSNYTQNTASSTSYSSVDFSTPAGIPTANQFTIVGGGGYRYISVAVLLAGAIASGNSWQLAIANLTDITYTVAESDLGYDSNASATISGSSDTLYADGKPTMGTLVKT